MIPQLPGQAHRFDPKLCPTRKALAESSYLRRQISLTLGVSMDPIYLPLITLYYYFSQYAS